MNNLDNFYNSVTASAINSFKIIFNYAKPTKFDIVKRELKNELKELYTKEFENSYSKMIAFKELLLNNKYDDIYRYAIKVKKSQDIKINNCKAQYHKIMVSGVTTKVYLIVNGGIKWIFSLSGDSFKEYIREEAKEKFEEKEDRKHFWLTRFTYEEENNEFRICLTKI